MFLISLVAWMIKPSVVLTLLAFEPDTDDDHKCADTIIKQIECRRLTLVNFDEDMQLAKKLHNSMKYEIIIRNYLETELNIPNEAYIVLCTYIEDCIEGLYDLAKDRYWNPTTAFCFIIKTTMKQDFEKLFEKLHKFYVFKTVILNNGEIYLYNFEVGNHCEFRQQAILKYQCKWLYDSRNSTITIIKQYLKEFHKTPYSDCSLRLRINAIKPYIFPKNNNNNDAPVGFEEEFVKLIINNFANVTYTYDMKRNVIGYVSPNFIATNSLADIQNGVVDGLLGATVLSFNRVSAFDFTTPHILDDIILTVPKAVHIEKWILMFTLFKPVIWALIFLTFFFMSILEFVMQVFGNGNSQVSITTKFDMLGHFTSIANKRSISYLIILWVLFTWYIAVFYQSALASVFTKPIFYKQINSLQELLEKNYELLLNNHINIFANNTKDLDLSAVINSGKSANCRHDLECMNIVAGGGKKYSLNSRLIFEYYEPKYHDENGEAKLFVLKEPYYHLLMTTYFKRGNPNVARIRFLERHIIASGLHLRSMLNLIHENKLKYYKFRSRQTKSLTFWDIAGLYYLFLIGSILAVIAFLCEILAYRQYHCTSLLSKIKI